MLRAKRRQEEERRAAAAAAATTTTAATEEERVKKVAKTQPGTDATTSSKTPSTSASTTETQKARATSLPAHKRLMQDLANIEDCKTYKLVVPDPDDIMHFKVTVTPVDGTYVDGEFVFSVSVPDDYPFSPPKVHCDTTVYHPFIDLDGHVCLNILRTDWKPVLDIQSVLFGLVLLFDNPDAEALNDPLNSNQVYMHTNRFHKYIFSFFSSSRRSSEHAVNQKKRV